MSDGHRPELRVGDVGPVDGGVDQHGTGDGGDRSNGAFSDAIMVVCAGACESLNLREARQVLTVIFGGERGAVVRDVLLWLYAGVETHKLEAFLGDEGLVGVQVSLELHVDEAGGVVDEHASAHEHLIGTCLTEGAKQTTFGGADEVVNGDTLSWKGVVCAENAVAFSCDLSGVTGGSTTTLLRKLAGSTLWWSRELTSGRMQASGGFRSSKSANLH